MNDRRQFFRQLGLVVGLGLIGIFVVGCGPSSEELKFEDSIAKTKKEFRLLDVSTAVMPLYAKYNHFDSDKDEIPTNEIPKIIFSLPVFQGAPPEYIRAFALHTNELMFMTGSGFGHWGVIVCNDATNNDLAKAYGNRVTLWGDGVYFYRE